MLDRNTKFRPVYGTETQILNAAHQEGWVYVAKDSGKIFLYADGNLKQIGGSGSGGGTGSTSIFWANGDEEENTIRKGTDDASDGDPVYYFHISAIENGKLPDKDALILNSDGRFFRVTNNTIDADQFFEVYLIAVSGGGSGGGGGGGASSADLSLTWDNIDRLGSTYIYGRDSEIKFFPNSLTDEICSIVVTAKDLTGNNPDVVRNDRVYNNEPFVFNANLLPASDNIEISVLINSDTSQYNRGRGLTITFSPIKVLDMHIEKPSTYMIGVQAASAQLSYMPFFTGLGTTENPVSINYSIDNGNIVQASALVAGNDKHTQYINIPKQSHGMHNVQLLLAVTINGKEYTSDPVEYEVPWIDEDNDSVIIWTKNDLGTIVNYEQAIVQYMVYSAVAAREGSPIEVSLYKQGVLLNTEEVYYDSSQWLSMDLTANYEPGQNNFVISVGGVSKQINFTVTTEGARDLSLRYNDQLKMNFDSLGRSSKEIRANRSTWKSKTTTPYEAILSDFNWYSNGWMNDNDGIGSYLAVANGASVTIPMDSISLNTVSSPYSFEIRFRIRNAKKFATLVTNIPKYKYKVNGIECKDGEEKTLEEIAELGGEVLLDEDGNMVMNEANTTKKIVQTEKYIAMKYLNNNNEGFAIGTQEAYFNTSGQTVNVKYKEGEIINITFVVDRQNDSLSIYLNGILSGVAGLAAVPAITMENIPFLINSNYCDFDLYKFRVYPVALTMPDVIHNYLSDIKDISLYDENQLTDINDATKLSYSALIEYNRQHPDDPTMPYAVIDMTKTSQGTDLPHYKGAKRKVRIEFTNPVADYLLESGQITPYQYYTHCPSFVADDVDIDVQGTSSQKYPRRNFKTKFKKAKNWKYIKGELANSLISDGGILASGQKISKKWHMDSEKLGVNTFTWKIDYMESSGSYNTGFANLMGSGVYDKHPLEDLKLNGVDASIYRTSVYGFPMLVFHKTGENEYTYIGRYNLNLDKSANERYGFEEEIEQPYLNKSWEDKDGNHHDHPWISQVAECWELRDNQGTWCSFRYPTQEMREMGFNARMLDSTEQDPKIEVVQHFEARYNAEADQFEYAQNILLGKENIDDFSDDIGGNTNAAASAYCKNKLSNLEVLFNWLDSTDTMNASSSRTLPAPVELEVNGKLTDPEKIAEAGVTYSDREVNGVVKTFGTFTVDSVEYRRQKFYAEFDKHLDRNYCAVYFVMTELLLCYDSRGKNMMIASFGPKEAGGDYIWYPIFYDIDTQLGLNNVGAKLWDYDEDNTENGTFSTKDSVLWTNFYDVFRNTVISTYRTLRNGKIDYDTIENSYRCIAGTTFDSYAMMGKRPIIAIGLDEYYKYVLPTKEKWKNQEGNWITANYLYACQGDRILSRELLINNRLLYMDSKWLGGNFTINTGGMSGLMFRSTGNKQSTTSDIYLDNEQLGAGQVYGEYPVPYFDATPEYNVTPYLNFYVTTFVDENVFQTPEAYNETKYPKGIPTPVSPSVLEGYRSGAPDQQLNYFAGSKYISSLGDLSLKYVNQVDMPDTPRLLDITLGSDVPGYFNNETLDPFNLHTGLDINGKVLGGDEKSLLEKIILTNVKGVNKYLDVRSPDKLREFRALGTSLTYALFADGAPLTTVHLPDTVTRLIFTQNKNLTKILTETPVILDMVEGVAVYRNPETYEGLFIDGITNYNSTMEGQGSAVNEISFEGDALGYGSYQILYNTVMKKKGTGRGRLLSIKMADINWTPYVQVEYGEVKMSNTQYYYLTDHSTYIPYTNPDSQWYEDTLNGKVYTYDSTKDESIITDLSLLDLFWNDKNNTAAGSINNFTNNIESMLNQQSYPTISGELFVSNSSENPIKESDLTNKYAAAWPNLKIRVANVEPAYIAKYIQRTDTGKDNELDVIRYEKAENTHPTVTTKTPVKQNYDFRGWTLDPTYCLVEDNQVENLIANEIILTENEQITRMTFDQDHDVYAFYAVFSITSYNINFLNTDDSIIFTDKVNYGSFLKEPSILPLSPQESSLPETERYKFLGWVANKEDSYPRIERSAKLVDVTKIISQNQDRTFYACYGVEDCLTNLTNMKYFKVNSAAFSDGEGRTINGVYIAPNPGVKLTGKITLPTTVDNQPVISITGFQDSNEITHVYWLGEPQLRQVGLSAFQNCTRLKYFDLPETTEEILDSAFAGCESLRPLDFASSNLRAVKGYAFNGAMTNGTAKLDILHLPGSLYEVGNFAFGYMLFQAGIGKLQIGGPGDPSQLGSVGDSAFAGDRPGNRYDSVEIYVSPNTNLDALRQYESWIGSNTFSYPNA